MEKKSYKKPVLEVCGRVSERTLGKNGYNYDPGQDSMLKHGFG